MKRVVKNDVLIFSFEMCGNTNNLEKYERSRIAALGFYSALARVVLSSVKGSSGLRRRGSTSGAPARVITERLGTTEGGVC